MKLKLTTIYELWLSSKKRNAVMVKLILYSSCFTVSSEFRLQANPGNPGRHSKILLRCDK